MLIFNIIVFTILFYLQNLTNCKEPDPDPVTKLTLVTGEYGQHVPLAKLIFGYDAGSLCKGECIFGHRYLSLFPLDISDEVYIESDLNEFTWKWIYTYADHIGVFKSSAQEPHNYTTSDIDPAYASKQSDFLSNFPVGAILTPCNREICMLGAFRAKWNILLPGYPSFKVDERVEKVLGPEADDQCIVLMTDILSLSNYYYICHSNSWNLWNMRIYLQESIDNWKAPEQFYPVTIVNQTSDELIEQWFHYGDRYVEINNDKDKTNIAEQKSTYLREFRLFYNDDLFDPASNMFKEMVFNNKTEKMEQTERDKNCIMFNVKKTNIDGQQYQGHEKFCVNTTQFGGEVSYVGQALLASQISTRVNTLDYKSRLSKSKVYMKECNMDECTSQLAFNNKWMYPILLEVHKQGLYIETICNRVVPAQVVAQKQCLTGKQNFIVQLIEELCEKQQECMKVVAEAIEDGKLPLTKNNAEISWDPYNVYREIDSVNLIEHLPPPLPDKDLNTTFMTPAQKQIHKLELEMGVELKDPVESAYYTNRPSVEELFKSIETLDVILKGGSLSSMKNLPYICDGGETDKDIIRDLAYIPILARFDPWLEYLGYVRDETFAKVD